jgi:hypothetical protein
MVLPCPHPFSLPSLDLRVLSLATAPFLSLLRQSASIPHRRALCSFDVPLSSLRYSRSFTSSRMRVRPPRWPRVLVCAAEPKQSIACRHRRPRHCWRIHRFLSPQTSPANSPPSVLPFARVRLESATAPNPPPNPRAVMQSRKSEPHISSKMIGAS